MVNEKLFLNTMFPDSNKFIEVSVQCFHKLIWAPSFLFNVKTYKITTIIKHLVTIPFQLRMSNRMFNKTMISF